MVPAPFPPAPSTTAQRVSTQPEPVSAEHIPTEPEHAGPVAAQPVDGEPVYAQPVYAQPLHTEGAEPEPTEPELIDAELIDAELVDADLVDAGLLDAEPAQGELAQASASHNGASAPSVSEPVEPVASTEPAEPAESTEPTQTTKPTQTTEPAAESSGRLGVRKTYKLYLGGAFPRSESGRSYPVLDAHGELLAHAAQASRKDVRDAVLAARKAWSGWAGATAYNRAQVLYRVAEMLEGRREQFAAEVAAAEGVDRAAALAQTDDAIDRWVYYAGWADKYAQVAGGTNPVSGPYFNFSLPEPTGVVAVIAPQDSSLLGLVSVLAPVITTGNTVVVVAAQARPLPAVSLAEVLATSDVPGGVVNVLTGITGELAPWLAGHRDVNAIDLSGVAAGERPALQVKAAENVKRVFAPGSLDWQADPGTRRLRAFVETKTVWHPIGS
jgi:hypothetical protein